MYSFVTLITYTSYTMPQGHTQYLFFKKLHKNLESLFPAYCHIAHNYGKYQNNNTRKVESGLSAISW